MALDIDMRSKGHQETEIKRIARLNMQQMVTDGGLDIADYPPLTGGLQEFRMQLQTMGTQFETDLTITISGSGRIWDSHSWFALRDTLGYNFELLDAEVNP